VQPRLAFLPPKKPDVAQGILAGPNNTQRFATIASLNVRIQRGLTLDGGKHLRQD
jgi:hypothetical protein